jgi:hypothetical protein
VSASESGAERRNLEMYTKYVLRSQRVPLGTMSQEEWDDVLAAFHIWTSQTTGYAIDSAEHLLQRLVHEMTAVSAALPGYNVRTTKLIELRHLVLRSWLKLHQQHSNSRMALDRAEKIVLDILQNDLMDGVGSFPVSELLILCDGWLQLKSPEGTTRAGELLLSCTADSYHPHLTDYSTELSLRFDQSLMRGLSHNIDHGMASELSSRLLDRIDFLKLEASWDGMELSEATRRAIEEASFQSFDDELSDIGEEASGVLVVDTVKATLSSFEAEAMEKRMIDVLRKAGTDDHQDVSKILPRIEAIEKPSDDLLFHVVDFYLRLGDVQSASIWIQRLPSAAVLSENSSSDERMALVDRLLDAWSLQTHRRAPWRAEEVFRGILDRAGDKATVTVPTVNRLLQIWSDTTDPAASRKVREWFSRMTDSMNLKPDATSLHLVLKAMDENSSASETLFARILDEWNGWEQNKKQEIVDTLFDVLWSSSDLPPAALTILARIKSDNLTFSQERYVSLLHRAFLDQDPNAVLETIERLISETDRIDLSLYEAGVYTLIKRDGKHLDTAEAIWRRALERVQSCHQSLTPDTALSAFLNGVMKTHTKWKHYSRGEVFLTTAESVLLPLSSNIGEKDGTSPIPLETYKALMIRNWYRPETANKAIEMFERIQSLYREGYTNLRPDQDVYLAYMRATAALSEDAADLENIMTEMNELYQESQDESCKPHADAFDVLLLAIKNKTNDPKEATRKALEIWSRLLRWDVTPNTKTINLVMNSVIKGNDPKATYLTVMDLYRKFEEFQLKPDSHTFHMLISACGAAGPNEREDALQLCLTSFGEIRRIGATTVFTYASLTKSLRRLLRGGPVPITDKVASSTLKLCYQDGLLAPEVREAYESMISNGVWKKIYGQYISPDNEEPEEWHRQLPKTSRS